jgi:hypothetical protein
MSRATTMTTARARVVWMVLPTTWPVRIEAREMAIVRKRATIPSVMSIAIEIAVPVAPTATVISRIPGTTYAMYAWRPPDTPPSPAPSVPPKT